MSRFSGSSNTKARSKTAKAATTTVVVNKAGGQAFKQSPKLELVNLVLSNMLSGDSYRSQGEVFNRLKALVSQVDPDFVARTALYARNVFGMRTTSQVLAGELASRNLTSGTSWGRDFYNAVVFRVDDMMEILGYYLAANVDKPIPNALKAGFAEAFKRFDAYQLAKYKADSRAVKLIDVVRLVRPKPNAKNEAALAALLKGELKNTKTWEAALSAAGQTEGDETAKAEAKNQAWGNLLKEKSLGYLALVRNLANISNDVKDEETFKLALELLVDKDVIEKSKIFPFQLYTAYKETEKRITDKRRAGKIMDALSQALDLSTANLPKFSGDTLIAIDNSGSMSSAISRFSGTSVNELATLFGVILARSDNNTDVVIFNDRAKHVAVPKTRSTLDNVKALSGTTGGTNFESIFAAVSKKYERIIVLSDMQAWAGATGGALGTVLSRYKANYNADPYIYSFDLAGQGDMQFREASPKVIALAGFSEKVFDLMQTAEIDRDVLIKAIAEYPIQVPRKIRKVKNE